MAAAKAEKSSAGRSFWKMDEIAPRSRRRTYSVHSAGTPRSDRHARSTSAALLGAPKAEAQAVGARRAAAAEGTAAAAEDAPGEAGLLAAGAPVTGGDKG